MPTLNATVENYKAATIKAAVEAGNYEHYVTHARLDECLEILRGNVGYSTKDKVQVGEMAGALCFKINGELTVDFICKKEGEKFALYELSWTTYKQYEAGHPFNN
jgi:hypothetical protein